jgi:hypothetical protein
LRCGSAIIEDNTVDMRGRAARGRLRLARRHGRVSTEGIRLNLTLSQTEFGSYVGLSRQNVSRQLRWLREANVVKFDRSHITITDEQGLLRVAGTSLSPPAACRIGIVQGCCSSKRVDASLHIMQLGRACG